MEATSASQVMLHTCMHGQVVPAEAVKEGQELCVAAVKAGAQPRCSLLPAPGPHDGVHSSMRAAAHMPLYYK